MQTTRRRFSTGVLALVLTGWNLWLSDARAASHTPVRLASPRPAGADRSLTLALDTLARVARTRDARGLKDLLASDVRLDDDVCGPAGVQQYWRFEQPGSRLWERLARAVELGGARHRTSDRRFILPWVASCWPAGVARSGRVAVVAPRVHLLERAEYGARVQAVVGNEILRAAGAHEATTPGWIKVRTPGRLYGFVRAEQVWSPTELVIELEPRGSSGAWKIVSIVTQWSDRSFAPPFTIPR